MELRACSEATVSPRWFRGAVLVIEDFSRLCNGSELKEMPTLSEITAISSSFLVNLNPLKY